MMSSNTFLWDPSYISFSSSTKEEKIRQINDEKSGRFYQVEDHKLFSITTVLGDDPKKKKALAEWRNRIGKKEADKVSRFASSRGTNVHSLFEKYIRGNETIDTSSLMPHVCQTFLGAKSSLDQNLTKIYYLEKRLYSTRLGIAGTVDGIVQWNGTDTILDFKTSRRLKEKRYIDDYFLQTTAYSLMLEEMTGKTIDQLCIFIANDEEPETPQVFLESRNNWTALLLKRVHDFYGRRNLRLPEIFG